MMPSLASKIDDIPPDHSPQANDGTRSPAVIAVDRSTARPRPADPESEDLIASCMPCLRA